jgi:Cu-Zn family superoxide dismutase
MQSPIVAALLAWSVGLAACGDAGRRDAGRDGGGPGAAQDSPTAAPAANNVTAPMRDPAGRDLGTLTLTEGSQGITVAGRLSGLPPGEHAIHLHAVGRCDPPDFKSAGDHWNPTNRQHGTKNPQGPHLGDLPNITVAQDSSVTVQATTPGGMLHGKNELLDGDGAAVVVHARRDDYRTQPSGNSGDRIACGVVTGG